MRPIDVCTSKPFQLEHSCFAVSQRSDRTRARSFDARPRAALVPEPRGSVLVRAKVFFCAPPRPSGDERCRHREARGRPMQTRPGRIAFHDAALTSATGRPRVAECSSAARGREPIASDAPVASSHSPHGLAFLRELCAVWEAAKIGSAGASWKACALPTRSAFRRQSPRATRSRRSTNEPARPPSKLRRSRDEDRRSPKDRPPFTCGTLLRLRAGVRPPVRLPFTRSTYRPGFRPDRYRWHASLSPRAFYRLLQYVRCTGTNLGNAASSFCGGRWLPLPAFASATPLRRWRRADEPRDSSPPERRLFAWTGPARVKVRAAFSTGRSPSSNQSRAPLSSRGPSYERRKPLAQSCPHRTDIVPARTRGRAITRTPVPAPPREGRCVQSKTEVRSTAVRLDGLEDRSSRSSEWVSRPRSTCAPKNTDALQITRTCAFFTAFRCPAWRAKHRSRLERAAREVGC